MSSTRSMFALSAGLLAWLACVGDAPAKPTPARGKQQAAVAQLDATYRSIATTAAPDRTSRACTEGEHLRAAVAALPTGAPVGAAIDDDAWHSVVSGLAGIVESLIAACRSPDHKIHHISGQIETAESCLAELDGEVQSVVNGAKARDLLPAMKRFQRTLQSSLSQPKSKQACKHIDELSKLLPELESSQSTSTQQWQQAHAEIARNLDQLKSLGCHGPQGSEVEFVDALTHVHDGFYKLVLLLPPRDG